MVLKHFKSISSNIPIIRECLKFIFKINSFTKETKDSGVLGFTARAAIRLGILQTLLLTIEVLFDVKILFYHL